MTKKYSKNERAKEIMGFRIDPKNKFVMFVDCPSDFGYACPKCKNKMMEWSEYDCFLWCEKCNIDIPTCLCVKDLNKATDVFLDMVEGIKKRLTK